MSARRQHAAHPRRAFLDTTTGQRILNSTGAREPEHTCPQPVAVTVRVVWENDGEELVETVAMSWTGRDVYVRVSDTRYQLRAVWLDADDVTRR